MSVDIQAAICLDAGSTPAVSIWRFQSFAVDAKILFKLGFWHLLLCARHGIYLAGESPAAGIYRQA